MRSAAAVAMRARPSMWLRSIRCVSPPPTRMAYLSTSPNPGVVFRVLVTQPGQPSAPARSAARRVSVATPLARDRMFSAARSASSRLRVGPVTVATAAASAAVMRAPSAAACQRRPLAAGAYSSPGWYAAGAPRLRLRSGLQPSRSSSSSAAPSAPAQPDFATLVTAEHKQLVRRQRTALSELRQAGVDIGADDADLQLLDDTVDQLDAPFMLCVVGEFNAGKSSIINGLLGAKHLQDGVTPTTDRVCLITGKHPGPGGVPAGVKVIELPKVPWLDGISIADTPGTNAVIKEHTRITDDIIPKCDLVLFCVSVDQPFSESERV
eukprot:SAG22_NODE_3628_length_1607_cov_0.947613_2_plen_322_part_01